MSDRKEELTLFLKLQREEIIKAFECFEPRVRFDRKPWAHIHGGGGEIGLLRGDVFEKAAVNFSAVMGPVFPGDDDHGPFFATGISLITHMQNPHCPTVHFNIRYIQTEKGHWFGGGYDLTPMGFPYEEDTKHFHNIAKNSLDHFDKTLYDRFSSNAREYFYIPHRKKERGVGGIFFDHYTTGCFDTDKTLWKQIGTTFLDAIIPIIKRTCQIPYTEEEKRVQMILRAHYVEFNLLYDRGTRFGFLSGGNPEAILCSMPPTASW